MKWHELLVLLALAAVATSSCGRRGGSEEDARRVELLLADPALDVEPDVAELVYERTHQHSTNWLGGDQNEVERVFDVTEPRSFMIEATTSVIEAGWSIHPEHGVNCHSSGGIHVLGTRVIDGLSASVQISVVRVRDEWSGSLLLAIDSGSAEPVGREGPALTTAGLASTCLGE